MFSGVKAKTFWNTFWKNVLAHPHTKQFNTKHYYSWWKFCLYSSCTAIRFE